MSLAESFARDGHVLVNIRKFTGIAYRHLDEIVDRGTLSPHVAEFLRACVRARLSIVFACTGALLAAARASRSAS